MAYVYRHIRLDTNQPFYIGIGSDSKGGYSRAKVKNRKNNKIWLRIASKTEFDVEILLDNVTWGEACIKEIEFIAMYGRIDRGTGPLANQTNGGDGNLGLQHSPAALKRISETSKNRVGYWRGKQFPLGMKQKMSAAKIGNAYTKGKHISESHKDAVRQHATGNKYCVGRVMSEETREKISGSNKGKPKKQKDDRVWVTGEAHPSFGKKHTAEQIIRNRLSQKTSRAVVRGDLDGNFVAEHVSIAEVCRQIGGTVQGVYYCCKHSNKNQSYRGFILNFKN